MVNMDTEVIVRKLGNSFRLVFPKEVVERKELKENEKIVINIRKKDMPYPLKTIINSPIKKLKKH